MHGFGKHASFMAIVCVMMLCGNTQYAVADEIETGRNGLIYSERHSMSQCVRYAQQACANVIGNCSNFSRGAAAWGGEQGYLVMYECHPLKLDRGGGTAVGMVIAGAKTANTNEALFNRWIDQSSTHVLRSFGMLW